MSILKIPPVQLDNNTSKKLFHAILEKQVIDIGSGVITVNVILKNSTPILTSLNMVNSKRRKYNLTIPA